MGGQGFKAWEPCYILKYKGSRARLPSFKSWLSHSLVDLNLSIPQFTYLYNGVNSSMHL